MLKRGHGSAVSLPQNNHEHFMKNVTTARLFVGTRHCLVLNLGNINISTGAQKPGFLPRRRVRVHRFGKNPVIKVVMRPGLLILTATTTAITARIYLSRHNYFIMVITTIITVTDNFILSFGLWGRCRDYFCIGV
jgi:hypothetical protein